MKSLYHCVLAILISAAHETLASGLFKVDFIGDMTRIGPSDNLSVDITQSSGSFDSKQLKLMLKFDNQNEYIPPPFESLNAKQGGEPTHFLGTVQLPDIFPSDAKHIQICVETINEEASSSSARQDEDCSKPLEITPPIKIASSSQYDFDKPQFKQFPIKFESHTRYKVIVPFQETEPDHQFQIKSASSGELFPVINLKKHVDQSKKVAHYQFDSDNLSSETEDYTLDIKQKESLPSAVDLPTEAQNSSQSQPKFQILCEDSQKSINPRKSKTNEDRILSTQFQIKATTSPVRLFGVFDGHGGEEVSEWLQKNFGKVFNKNLNSLQSLDNVELIKEAINESVYEADAQLYDEGKSRKNGSDYGFDAIGSTASFFVTFDSEVYVVNIGDSRSIIFNYDTQNIEFETKDHEPKDPIEKQHIKNYGGFVAVEEVEHEGRIVKTLSRVNLGLATSRAFGDFAYKINGTNFDEYQPNGMVRVTPDIYHYKVEKGANLVLFSATDGLFNSENSMTHVVDSMKEASTDSCSNLIKTAVDSTFRQFQDDNSVIMAKLNL